MPDDLSMPFERVVYHDGQLLTAQEMRDAKLYEDRLRWLHVKGLHDTWGIVFGLSVNGKIGERSVTIEPGYALDDEGRDILHPAQLEIPLPNILIPATLVLTVSFEEDATFRGRSQLGQVCLREELSVRSERANFSWQQLADVRFGPQVPLVKVEIAGGVLQSQLDFRVRRYARRQMRPVFGWGSTEPGETNWTLKNQPQPGKPDLDALWLQATVDTSEAGFIQTPYYFAFLRGYGIANPESLKTESDMNYAISERRESTVLLSHLSFIKNATPQSFTYQVLHQTTALPGVPVNDINAERLHWTIDWFGLEPARDYSLIIPLLHFIP